MALFNLLPVLVGAVLLSTGFIHASQPYYFVHTVSSYEVLPAWAAGVVGIWLPYFQIVVALCMVLRIVERTALILASALFAVFAISQVSVLVRGLEIDCGCFGNAATAISPATVSVPAALFIVCQASLFVGKMGRKSESPLRVGLPSEDLLSKS